MKKRFITNILFILFAVIITKNALANMGLPGFSSVGTGRTFIPTFSKETKYADKIMMQSELVKVNLYKGFAVVKGEYNMLNTSNKPITMNVGYPENGVFLNPILQRVIFNEMDNLQVFVEKNNSNQKVSYSLLKSDLEGELAFDKWYIWKTTFLPGVITKVTVYYMLDTHYAHIRKGYDSSRDNGFAYILESGNLWKDKIGKGLIYIKLMDELTEKNLIGVLPEDKLSYDPVNNSIIYQFSNLEPGDNNNIIIRYEDKTKNFNYDNIKKDFNNYYSKLDSTETNFDSKNLQVVTQKDFSVFSYTTLVILGILAFILLVILLFIWLIFKFIMKIFRKKRST